MKNSNVWNTLRQIMVFSMNPMGQLSPRRPLIEGSPWTPEGELLIMIYAHCHSSYLHTNSMISTSLTWPQRYVKTDNGIKHKIKEKRKRKNYMYWTYKLVSESVLSKCPLCGKCYRTWLDLQSVWQLSHVPIYKESGVLIIIFMCLNVLSEEVDKTQR